MRLLTFFLNLFFALLFSRQYTGERIPWRPKQAAARKSNASADLFEDKDEPAARLPQGWVAKASRSNPNETVYENKWTGERVKWAPTRPAARVSDASPDLFHDDYEPPLPKGWEKATSRSNPGVAVYQNVYTGERIPWLPVRPAARKSNASADLFKDNSDPLPEGWKEKASRTKPGEVVYENVFTGERVEWRPEAPAARVSNASEDLFRKHVAVKTGSGLPPGWVAAKSRSNPNETVYQNKYTGERVPWKPTRPAARQSNVSPDLFEDPEEEDDDDDGQDDRRRQRRAPTTAASRPTDLHFPVQARRRSSAQRLSRRTGVAGPAMAGVANLSADVLAQAMALGAARIAEENERGRRGSSSSSEDGGLPLGAEAAAEAVRRSSIASTASSLGSKRGTVHHLPSSKSLASEQPGALARTASNTSMRGLLRTASTRSMRSVHGSLRKGTAVPRPSQGLDAAAAAANGGRKLHTAASIHRMHLAANEKRRRRRERQEAEGSAEGGAGGSHHKRKHKHKHKHHKKRGKKRGKGKRRQHREDMRPSEALGIVTKGRNRESVIMMREQLRKVRGPTGAWMEKAKAKLRAVPEAATADGEGVADGSGDMVIRSQPRSRRRGSRSRSPSVTTTMNLPHKNTPVPSPRRTELHPPVATTALTPN